MDSERRLVKDLMVTSCLTLAMSFGLGADIKYEEFTRISCGAMEGVTKTLGFFGMKGLNNVQSTTYIKGDRLRRDSFNNNQLTRSEIILLDREEVITVDHQKKSYSVITFEEMRRKMREALEKMNKGKLNQATKLLKRIPKIPTSSGNPKSPSRTRRKPGSSMDTMPNA
jgi:hypothetical protein